MGDPYVTFPTAAYASIPDLNLLDADTAHLSQSDGAWTGADSLQSDPATFSGKAMHLVDAAGSSPYPFSIPVASAPAVSSSTQYTFSFRYKRVGATGTADGVRVLARDYDAGNVAGTTHTGPATTIVQDQYVHVEHTFTTASDAAKLRVWVNLVLGTVNENLDIGETCRVGDVCLRAGSDGSFVPSLDVVGTLFEEKSPSGLTVAYVKGTDLRIADGSAEDASVYRRYDGANASAPLVCEFLASDVLEEVA